MGSVTVSTSARITTADGRLAAVIDLVPVGGGTQTKTVDGQPEDVTHPSSTVFHVRLLSPIGEVPDELREVDSYDEAVKAGVAYAERLDQRVADAVAALQG